MHDTHHDCERWQEAISLFAANCLTAAEEVAVRQHLADCETCAARFCELAEVAARLKAASPSAAIHVGAIRQRWSESANCVTPRRAVVGGRPGVLGLSGALAVSLLVGVLWWANREPRVRPELLPGPGAADTAKSGGVDAGRPSPPAPRPGVPGRGEIAPNKSSSSQPTLLAYERAFAQSDAAFDTLLQRHGEAVVFEPYKAQSLLQESYQ